MQQECSCGDSCDICPQCECPQCECYCEFVDKGEPDDENMDDIDW
jgi:hypothetical protein